MENDGSEERIVDGEDGGDSRDGGDVLCSAESLSRVRLFATPWAVAPQAPLSMGILQARILECVVMSSSRGPSQPRDQTQVSQLQADSSLSQPPGKPMHTGVGSLSLLQGIFLSPGIELGSPALQADSLPAELPEKPQLVDTML